MDAPIGCTMMGISAVPTDHPRYLGMEGMHGHYASSIAQNEADLIVTAGCRFSDRGTGNTAKYAKHAKIIHIDIDASELNKNITVELGIAGSMKQILAELTAMVPQQQHPEWDARIQELVATTKELEAQKDDELTPFTALDAVAEAAKNANEDVIVATDVGQHQMWSAQHMTYTRPENFITSSGLGTMGFGLPAAVGAQVARPNDTVICISGDGSFMMNVQELGTVKRKQLPLKIVLLDNQRLGMVRQWQQLFFQERYSETTLTDNPDFLTLASAFGIPGQHITRKDQVEAALDTMLSSQGPYLLHVSIDELENVWPLVPPGASNSEMLEKLS